MFSIDVPKDVRKVQSKFIGPLTFRQTIWGLIGGACGYLASALHKAIMGPDVPVSGFVVMLFMTIPGIIGFIPLKGMPAEKFLKYAILSTFIYPTKRKYVIKNQYGEIFRKANETYDAEETAELKKRMNEDKQFKKDYLRSNKEMKKQIQLQNKEFLVANPMYK